MPVIAWTVESLAVHSYRLSIKPAASANQNVRHKRSLSLSHLSPNREGRWGTTDDFATSFLHFCLFSTALRDLANSRPVHSLMLSFHLFLRLLCLLPSFIVPSKMALARPDEQET